jgi:hypothetical protein
MPTPGTASHQEYNAALIAQLRAELQPGLRPIKEFRLAAPAGSVIFTNIPGNYRTLMLHAMVRSTRAAPNESDSINVICNADVGPRYHWGYLQRSGGAFASGEFLAQNSWLVGSCEAGGSTANAVSPLEMKIIGYNRSSAAHYFMATSTIWGNVSAAADFILSKRGGRYAAGGAAITSLTVSCVFGNIDTNSILTLYGVL